MNAKTSCGFDAEKFYVYKLVLSSPIKIFYISNHFNLIFRAWEFQNFLINDVIPDLPILTQICLKKFKEILIS